MKIARALLLGALACASLASVSATQCTDGCNAAYDACDAKMTASCTKAGALSPDYSCMAQNADACFWTRSDCIKKCDPWVPLPDAPASTSVGWGPNEYGNSCESRCYYAAEARYERVTGATDENGPCDQFLEWQGIHKRRGAAWDQCAKRAKAEADAWGEKCVKCCDPLQKWIPWSECSFVSAEVAVKAPATPSVHKLTQMLMKAAAQANVAVGDYPFWWTCSMKYDDCNKKEAYMCGGDMCDFGKCDRAYAACKASVSIVGFSPCEHKCDMQYTAELYSCARDPGCERAVKYKISGCKNKCA